MCIRDRSCNGQKKLNLAEQLREALSDWIIGKVSLDEIGIKCVQLVRRAMDEAGICDSCPSPDSITPVSYTHLDVYKRQAWMHSICQTVHLLM